MNEDINFNNTSTTDLRLKANDILKEMDILDLRIKYIISRKNEGLIISFKELNKLSKKRREKYRDVGVINIEIDKRSKDSTKQYFNSLKKDYDELYDQLTDDDKFKLSEFKSLVGKANAFKVFVRMKEFNKWKTTQDSCVNFI